MNKEVIFPTETDIEVITISKQNEHPTLSHKEAVMQARYELEVLLPKCNKLAKNGSKECTDMF